jgi:DHA2 family multidrug resistance protein
LAVSDETVPPAKWIGFLALCIGMFMAILDIQIVATALPDMQASLHISMDLLSWVQTAYLIAEVIAIPLTGWLASTMSTRWLFVAAISCFTIASAGCANSSHFTSLITWRIIQGFAGGAIIPSVFSACFIMFPKHLQDRATMIASVIALMAPTMGPLIGGWITETYSWHWLFLINIVPGLLVVATVAALVDVDQAHWDHFVKLDYLALGLLALALACLEILLKQAPEIGWTSWQSLSLGGLSVGGGIAVIRRCSRASEKLVDFENFRDRNFTIGCWYSFTLGAGLYGSVYLMPLFLAFVREHSPLEIGEIVVVTGLAQVLVAPIAVVAEARFDCRLVTLFGYLLLAIGLLWGGTLTYQSDFNELFWPQVVRGMALPFCLLPTTRLALGRLPVDRLQSASGLFNLMRNLGGAIGIALIDTVLETRSEGHATALVKELQAGNRATALFVGLPPDRFHGQPMGPADQATVDLVAPLVRRAATVMSFNEAWLMLGLLLLVSLMVLPILKKVPLSLETAPKECS